jgi:molecular chaperone DnaK (HSP70)
MAPVRQALEGASVAPEEVDEVVLVGGSSRLPMVRARLREIFGGRDLRSKPGLVARVFGALARAEISVEMISHGANNINVGLLVDDRDVKRAVPAIHAALLDEG